MCVRMPGVCACANACAYLTTCEPGLTIAGNIVGIYVVVFKLKGRFPILGLSHIPHHIHKTSVQRHSFKSLFVLLITARAIRTQHVGTALHNIVGIVLADVGVRVFKRSQYVGQCCFYDNTECCHGLVFTQDSLRNCNFVMFVDEYRRRKTRKCIAIAIVLCHLENTPSHINKNRKLKQRGWERQRERYKTIDLITLYNHFMWECNHLTHRSPENKRNVGRCWAKSLTAFKLDATHANIMQHSPTWCTNERNMLSPTCWHNMLRSFARALRPRANEHNMLAQHHPTFLG